MFRKNIIYFVVILIGALLLTDILLTRHNNKIIRNNRDLQGQTELIKRYHDQIGRIIIHPLDIGLRGFAIVKEARFSAPMDNAKQWSDSIFSNVEMPLKKLNYDLDDFYTLRDSVKAYTEYCFYLRQLLIENRTEDFIKLFSVDRGAGLWGHYLESEEKILAFTTYAQCSFYTGQFGIETMYQFEICFAHHHIRFQRIPAVVEYFYVFAVIKIAN